MTDKPSQEAAGPFDTDSDADTVMSDDIQESVVKDGKDAIIPENIPQTVESHSEQSQTDKPQVIFCYTYTL